MEQFIRKYNGEDLSNLSQKTVDAYVNNLKVIYNRLTEQSIKDLTPLIKNYSWVYQNDLLKYLKSIDKTSTRKNHLISLKRYVSSLYNVYKKDNKLKDVLEILIKHSKEITKRTQLESQAKTTTKKEIEDIEKLDYNKYLKFIEEVVFYDNRRLYLVLNMWQYLPFRNDIFRLILTTKSKYNSLSPLEKINKNFIIIGKKNLIIRHDYKTDNAKGNTSFVGNKKIVKPNITDLDDNKYKLLLKKIKEHIKYYKLQNGDKLDNDDKLHNDNKLKNCDYLFKFKDSYYNEKNMDSNMKKYSKILDGVKINQKVLCKVMIHNKFKNKTIDDKVKILEDISKTRPSSFQNLCIKYEINAEFLKNYSNNSESTDLSE